MQKLEKISVVIPFYADPELHTHVRFSLPLCLIALLESPSIAEIILVDDGSTVTVKIPDSPKIRVFHNKHMGLGFSRNLGIDKTTNPFILMLDSDIILSTQLIDLMLETLKLSGYYFFACVDHVKAFPRTLWSRTVEEYWLNNEQNPWKNWLSCGCMLVKREAFEIVRFREDNLWQDEDTVFSNDRLNFKLHAITLSETANHVFCTDLKGLKRKWFYGGIRVRNSRSKTSLEVAKGFACSSVFGVKLSLKFRNPFHIVHTVLQSFYFTRGFYQVES